MNRNIASVDATVRCSRRVLLIQPISMTPFAGSMRISAAVPTGRPVARSVMVWWNGSAVSARRSRCVRNAASVAGRSVARYVQSRSSGASA